MPCGSMARRDMEGVRTGGKNCAKKKAGPGRGGGKMTTVGMANLGGGMPEVRKVHMLTGRSAGEHGDGCAPESCGGKGKAQR